MEEGKIEGDDSVSLEMGCILLLVLVVRNWGEREERMAALAAIVVRGLEEGGEGN